MGGMISGIIQKTGPPRTPLSDISFTQDVLDRWRELAVEERRSRTMIGFKPDEVELEDTASETHSVDKIIKPSVVAEENEAYQEFDLESSALAMHSVVSEKDLVGFGDENSALHLHESLLSTPSKPFLGGGDSKGTISASSRTLNQEKDNSQKYGRAEFRAPASSGEFAPAAASPPYIPDVRTDLPEDLSLVEIIKMAQESLNSMPDVEELRISSLGTVHDDAVEKCKQLQEFWMKKLNVKTTVHVESMHDNMDALIDRIQVLQTKVPPIENHCSHFSQKLAECYSTNKKDVMQCRGLVQQFFECVEIKNRNWK